MDMRSTMTLETAMTPEMKALKARLKAMWMAGDYGHFARYLEPGALAFFPRLGIVPGQRILDVACGAGQLSLPAARAGADVTGVDIATNLLDQARARARAAGLAIRFEEADAEDLPFDDATFDVVFSLIGAMFAPGPERVAAELLRVCKPGGRIVMGNWTAAGFVGRMFGVVARHVPPPAGMPSPVLWGDEAVVRDRLKGGVAEIRLTRRMYPMQYPFPPAEVVEFFRTYYGPTNRAFAALTAERQAELRGDLEALWATHNRSDDGKTAVEAEYLEVVSVRS